MEHGFFKQTKEKQQEIDKEVGDDENNKEAGGGGQVEMQSLPAKDEKQEAKGD
jgi:hypothetical protein